LGVSKSLRLKNWFYTRPFFQSVYQTIFERLGWYSAALQSFSDLKITKCFGHLVLVLFQKRKTREEREQKKFV